MCKKMGVVFFIALAGCAAPGSSKVACSMSGNCEVVVNITEQHNPSMKELKLTPLIGQEINVTDSRQWEPNLIGQLRDSSGVPGKYFTSNESVAVSLKNIFIKVVEEGRDASTSPVYGMNVIINRLDLSSYPFTPAKVRSELSVDVYNLKTKNIVFNKKYELDSSNASPIYMKNCGSGVKIDKMYECMLNFNITEFAHIIVDDFAKQVID